MSLYVEIHVWYTDTTMFVFGYLSLFVLFYIKYVCLYDEMDYLSDKLNIS